MLMKKRGEWVGSQSAQSRVAQCPRVLLRTPNPRERESGDNREKI